MPKYSSLSHRLWWFSKPDWYLFFWTLRDVQEERAELYNKIKVYKSPELYTIRKFNDWMCSVADKKAHGKIPTALKTCISQLIEHLHIYHVMSSSQQPCEIQIISLSQVRTKHWLSGLPHVTESCSKVVSMQTQTEIFASASYFCSDSLPLRTLAAQHWSDAFLRIFPTWSLSVPSNLLESLHQSNWWCPLPTAVEASNSYNPSLQPLCL